MDTGIVCIKDKIKNLNIVVGCPIGCRYCYARNNCRRFHITEDFSKPEFFPGKLRLFDTKEPKLFLLTGMSDPAYWEKEWLDIVYEKAAATKHNRYLFLTKRPDRLNIADSPENIWFGVSVTCAAEKERIDTLKKNVKASHYHVTFEPLSDGVGKVALDGIDWVVIGTETGNAKGKIPTKREWAESLYEQAAEKGIPVFMKEDLCGIVPPRQMIQQFPEEFDI